MGNASGEQWWSLQSQRTSYTGDHCAVWKGLREMSFEAVEHSEFVHKFLRYPAFLMFRKLFSLVKAS